MRKLIAMIIVGLSTSGPALPWHETGHKASAAIAFDQLSTGRQQETAAVLRAHPRFEADFQSRMPAEILHGSAYEQGRWLFEQASIWPDLIQTLDDQVRSEYHRSRWHYINLPVWMTEDDVAALRGKLDHNMATTFEQPLRQNLNIVQALRGNLLVWRDDSSSDAEKAVALCWILHLVADLHQPLHTVALFSAAWFPTGDRGGNNIAVRSGEDTRNLHAVWDGLPTDIDTLEPTACTARSVKEDIVNDAEIDDWLRHHAWLAEKFVYPDDVRDQLLSGLQKNKSPAIVLSRDYLIAARTIARRQVNLAGHRTAALID